jgi:hypothetical protein
VILGVALLLPRAPGVPIRPAAVRAALVMGLQVVGAMLIAAHSIWFGPTLFSYFAPLVSGVVVATLWLLLMTPASDVCGEFVPPTPEEQAEYQAILNVLGPGQSVSRYIRLRMNTALRSHAAMQAGDDQPSK